MSEWRNEIVQIENISRHENADNLEICTILGDYPVITKKGEYKIGDLACYISENTLVPDISTFYFLSPSKMEKYFENGEFKGRPTGEKKYPLGQVPEKYRIVYDKKIRGEYSTGLLIPVPDGFRLGDSVNDLFGLQKVDEKDEEETITQKVRSVNSYSPSCRRPEGWDLPYYDIAPLRSNLNQLWPGEAVVLTAKLHGSWFSATHDGLELWIKSRNFFKKKTEQSPWWKAAGLYNLEEKLKPYPLFAFCGEIVGHQKNKGYQFWYDAEIQNGEIIEKLHFFHIYDIQSRKQLPYDEVKTILQSLNLPMVPELYRGPWLGKEKMYPFAEGQDPINPKHIREGFVLQTLDKRRDEYLGQREFKHVGEGYKLSKQGIRLALNNEE